MLQELKTSGVVAVVRGALPERIIPLCQALHKGGVKIIELTMETPGVLGMIERVAAEMGDDVLVGAGTVLDAETARAAIMAGAQFIFSPTVNVETIRLTKRYGVLSIPGALTPTEIISAYEQGADLIKVFPASVFGPSYLKDVHGPLPHVPLMPTGGVTLNNVAEYITAGALAVGVGSALVDSKRGFSDEALLQLSEKAAQFSARVKQAREKQSGHR